MALSPPGYASVVEALANGIRARKKIFNLPIAYIILLYYASKLIIIILITPQIHIATILEQFLQIFLRDCPSLFSDQDTAAYQHQ